MTTLEIWAKFNRKGFMNEEEFMDAMDFLLKDEQVKKEELRGCLRYCLAYNGLPHCKNCGLCEDMI
jgi:hypothetical protein